MEEDRARLQRADFEAALMRERHAADGDVRFQRNVGIGFGRVKGVGIGKDRGHGRGSALAQEVIDHDEAAAGGIGARGDAERGLVAGGKRGIVMAAGEQGRETFGEVGGAARGKVEIVELPGLADGCGIIVRDAGLFAAAGVAEIGAAVRHVVVVAGTAERDDFPGTADLLRQRVGVHVAILADPARPEFGAVPGRRIDREWDLAGGIGAVVQAGIEGGHLDAVAWWPGRRDASGRDR